jgi:glutaredoxin 3
MYLIYSMPNCPYCTQAKNALTAKGIGYTEKLLEDADDRRALLEKLGNGWRSFPVIFAVDSHGKPNRFIGGFDKLMADLSEGTAPWPDRL